MKGNQMGKREKIFSLSPTKLVGSILALALIMLGMVAGAPYGFTAEKVDQEDGYIYQAFGARDRKHDDIFLRNEKTGIISQVFCYNHGKTQPTKTVNNLKAIKMGELVDNDFWYKKVEVSPENLSSLLTKDNRPGMGSPFQSPEKAKDLETILSKIFYLTQYEKKSNYDRSEIKDLVWYVTDGANFDGHAREAVEKLLKDESVKPSGKFRLYLYEAKQNYNTKLYPNGLQNLIGGAFSINETEQVSVKLALKKVAEDGTPLIGAQLKFERVEGGAYSLEWTSTNDVKTVDLAPGEYLFKETKAPEGYIKADDIRLRVTSDGKVEYFDNKQWVNISKTDDKFIVTMEDKSSYPSGKFGELKTSVKAGSEQGSTSWPARLVSRETVEEEVTDQVSYTDLVPGKTYTLTGRLIDVTVNKTIATKAETFTSQGDGTVQVKFGKVKLEPGHKYVIFEKAESNEEIILNKDTLKLEKHLVGHENPNDVAQTIIVQVPIKFSKLIAGQGAELEGAELKIIGAKTGHVYEQWTSTGTGREVELIPGEYKLVEDRAPLGFDVAEAIYFKVAQNGQIQLWDEKIKKWGEPDGFNVTMEDRYTSHKVAISKQILGQGKELAGANLTLKSIDDDHYEREWVSTGEARNLWLEMGIYELTETSAPLGYEIAESIKFKVLADGKLEVKNSANGLWEKSDKAQVVMEDKAATAPVVFSKVIAGQGDELKGASLKVVKGDKADGGDVVKSWTSTGSPETFALDAGVYSLVEDQAPLGFLKAEAITFRVSFTGEGKKVEILQNGEWVVAKNSVVVMEDARDTIPETPNPESPKPKQPTPKQPIPVPNAGSGLAKTGAGVVGAGLVSLLLLAGGSVLLRERKKA
ncbi:SpaA isopeptide-forming pilin-related protein [Arcanobacterium phocae]|nr:SpaA isopeptide-forming pilin-related protein [Arcanobacterium phocae]